MHHPSLFEPPAEPPKAPRPTSQIAREASAADAPPPAKPRALPFSPDRERINRKAADRERSHGAILDAMTHEAVEAICMEIFPAWPRVFGPYPYTPQSARKDPVTRRLLLAAIAEILPADCPEESP